MAAGAAAAGGEKELELGLQLLCVRLRKEPEGDREGQAAAIEPLDESEVSSWPSFLAQSTGSSAAVSCACCCGGIAAGVKAAVLCAVLWSLEKVGVDTESSRTPARLSGRNIDRRRWLTRRH